MRAPGHGRRRSLWRVASVAGVLASSLTGLMALAPTASAAPPSCNFAAAGTGTYASTLCWFDLSSYDAAQATAAGGQQMTMAIPGGYSISYTLNVSGSAVVATSLPTYAQAFLGRAGYTGIAGDPALYQTAAGTTTMTLSAITVTNSSGTVVHGYSLVGADAESTDNSESLTWTSSDPIESLTATSSGNGIGNACGGGFTGVGTTTVTCGGLSSGNKTGAAILASEAPSTFTQTMVGGGLEAVGFGVLISQLELNKTVVNRLGTDAFKVSVADASASVLGTANTSGGSSASTGEISVLAGTDGESYTFSETATTGTLANYDKSWSCTRNGAADPTLPSGAAGSSATVTLDIGDSISCTITNTARSASLTLTKHAGTPVDVNNDGLTDAGDTIPYTFDVTNNGLLTIDSVGITDVKLGSVTCPQPSLASGASETCTADSNYQVTAADVTAGVVTNSATATGTVSGSTATVTSPPSTTSTPTTAPQPGLKLQKSVSPGTVSTLGQTVTYSFKMTNTGNVTLTDGAVAETGFTGSGTVSTLSCPAGAASMAPSDSVTCTATYAVTQADLDAGSVSNSADASATDPSGATVSSLVSTATVTVNQNPSLTVQKSVLPISVSRAGQTLTYSFVITNTGNVTLTNAAVDEGVFTGDGSMSAATCPAGAASMAPGAQVTCTATYTVDQVDIDNGTISNTATATATPPPGLTGPIESPPSTVTMPEPASPGLSVDKEVTPTTVSAAGQTLSYTFLVTNTGNVTMHGISINEIGFTGSGTAPAASCPAGAASLLPGAQVTCTASYTVTQADIDDGSVSNTATASGRDPSSTVVTSGPSSAIATATARPALTVAKTALPTTVSAAGQTVTYSFLVTNTGNVTMHGITTDEVSFSGTGTLSAVNCPAGAAALAPTTSVTCTATYRVTLADIDAGSVTNTATATGTDPDGDSITSAGSTATVTASAAAALSVSKTVLPTAVSGAGQTVTYSFLVTNTGNVTVHGVTPDEVAFSGTGTLATISCPAGAASMAPGDQVTCTATYDVTQADLDAGSVTNTATATGTDPSGGTVTAPQSAATLAVTAAPALSISKSASPDPVTAAGQIVTYSFLVTNTGNVTMHAITVNEGTFSGTGTLSPVSCPAGAASLAPTESVTCTATYSVTQADMDAGSVSNTATASGRDPSDGPHTSLPDTETLTATAEPALTIDKTPSPASVSALGETVTYSFLVTNIGNVTMHTITVNEGAFSGTGTLSAVSCPAGAASLAPTESVTCTATYQVTQADLDAGSVTNVADASALDPAGDPTTSPNSTATVSVTADPELTLVKSASPVGPDTLTPGEVITYSFLLTNTGNVTLTDAAVDEGNFTGSGLLSAITCPAGVASLAPGDSVTCTATYTVTQPDVDAGTIDNGATATATPPTGNPGPIVSPPSTVTMPQVAQPALTVTKSVTPDTVTTVGQTVTYSFLVINVGNVTLTDATIDDSAFTGTGAVPSVDCPAGTASMAPGARLTCTATYDVTQADLDAGSVSNTATASADPPTGPAVTSPPSTASFTATSSPGLEVTKTATPTTLSHAGQTLTYSFLVTNTGNVTLSDVGVDDSDFTGTGTLSAVTCPAAATSLAPGDSVTCTATYVVTQADVDSGSLANTATASAQDPAGDPITSTPSTVSEPTKARSALGLAKYAHAVDVNGDGVIDVSDRIHWSIVVTNLGQTTITHIVVVDRTAGRPHCPKSTLAPGASTTCTVRSHRVTDRDVSAGQVLNVATASGTVLGTSRISSAPARASTHVFATPPGSGGPNLPFTGFGGGGGFTRDGIVMLVLGGILLAVARPRRRRFTLATLLGTVPGGPDRASPYAVSGSALGASVRARVASRMSRWWPGDRLLLWCLRRPA